MFGRISSDRNNRAPFAPDEKGQAITEYVLLMVIVVSTFLAVLKLMDRVGVSGKLAGIVTGPYKNTYQFGHPEASIAGASGGETKNHPRVVGDGTNNFRIFLRNK